MARVKKAKEPTFDRPLTETDVTKTLNWYNNNRSANDARKFLHEYVKANIDSKLTIPDISKWKYVETDCWISRLLTLGVKFPYNNVKQNHNKRMRELMREALEEEKPKVIKPAVKPTNPVNNYKRVDGVLGELEHDVDNFIENDCRSDFKLSRYLIAKNITKKVANNIKRWAKTEVKRYAEVLVPKPDKQLKEGYSNFSKPQLKRLQKFYQSFYDDADAHIKNSKKTRKKVKKNGGSETQASLEAHLSSL